MKTSIRYSALLIALLTALVFICACGHENADPEPTHEPSSIATDKDGNVLLTDAQEERVRELASAFYRFGPCKMKEGVSVSRLEYIIFCLYCEDLEPSETEGFGCITKEDADKAVDSVFSGVKIPDLVRAKYDPDKEQDYYLLDDKYYIRLTDDRTADIEIRRCEKRTDEETGSEALVVEVHVTTVKGGEGDLRLELAPSNENIFTLLDCEALHSS